MVARDPFLPLLQLIGREVGNAQLAQMREDVVICTRLAGRVGAGGALVVKKCQIGTDNVLDLNLGRLRSGSIIEPVQRLPERRLVVELVLGAKALVLSFAV